VPHVYEVRCLIPNISGDRITAKMPNKFRSTIDLQVGYSLGRKSVIYDCLAIFIIISHHGCRHSHGHHRLYFIANISQDCKNEVTNSQQAYKIFPRKVPNKLIF